MKAGENMEEKRTQEETAQDAVKQVVKTKKRPRGGNSPVIGDNGVSVTKDENAAMCKYALNIFHAAPVDLRDPDAVSAAIDNYFNDCIERGLRPGNLGLYASLGLSKQEVSSELRGVTHRLDAATKDLIKKAKVALSTYREMLGSTGKINPVTLIFWQKNYDGLEDKQTMEITPRQTMEPDKTPEEIARQLEQDIPVDVDFEDIN